MMKYFSLILLSVMILFQSCDPCVNTVREEILSPDGKYRAVIFERDCGATTGFNRQLSIVPSNKKLKNEKGNVFIIEGEIVSTCWKTPTTFVIIYNGNRECIFLQKETYNDVSVSYVDSEE